MPLKRTEKSGKETIELPIYFLERFLPKAPPPYCVIYIYAYALCCQGDQNLSNSQIASTLNLMESDVVRAWKYWQEQNIISYEEESETITFLPFSSPETKKEKPLATIQIERKPNYTPEELSIYMKKSNETRELFSSAQGHLGKMLSYQEMSSIFSLYDWLGLSMEMIEILLAYCSQNNHRSMRYIEKVAIDWVESGIDTPQKALSRIKLYNNKYRQAMKAMGQNGRDPSPSEETFMKKWYDEYHFSEEIVVKACDRTVLNTGKPSFAYANSILESWYKQKVKTLDDISKLENDYTAAKKAKTELEAKVSPKKTASPPVRKNRFINYDQREWDFDSLEKMEKEHLKKKLEE